MDTSETGEYTVRYTAEDGAGNKTEISRTVVVVDTRKPVITMNGSDEVSVECKDTYSDAGATADDCCDGDLTEQVATDDSSVDTDVPGTYTVTYDVSDDSANAADTVTRTVIVEDTIPPEITLMGESSMTVECGDEFEDPGATAYDDCDGDVTDCGGTGSGVDPSQPGEYTIEYNASDSAGNEAETVTRTVTVVDTTPPVITLTGESSVTVECGEGYSDAGATASDACEGDLTGSLVIVNSVNASEAGTYTVTYNVSDSSGNAAAEVSREVTVILDTVAPEIELIGDSEVTIACGETYKDEGATATDDCDGDLTSSIRTKWRDDDPSEPDKHVLIYTVEDNAGNEATVTRTIIVNSPCDDEWVYTLNAQVVGAPEIAEINGEISETGGTIQKCDYSWTISGIATGESVEALLSTGLGICLVSKEVPEPVYGDTAEMPVFTNWINTETPDSPESVKLIFKDEPVQDVTAEWAIWLLSVSVLPVETSYHLNDEVIFKLDSSHGRDKLQYLLDKQRLELYWSSDHDELEPNSALNTLDYSAKIKVNRTGTLAVSLSFYLDNKQYQGEIIKTINIVPPPIYKVQPIITEKGSVNLEPASSSGLERYHYYEGEKIKLTAEPVNSDWALEKWRLEKVDESEEITEESPEITVDCDMDIYAEFIDIPPWRLTCVYPNEVVGTIQVNSSTLRTDGKYDEGDLVQLTAYPNESDDYTFNYWFFKGTKQQYISYEKSYSLTMDQHYTVFTCFGGGPKPNGEKSVFYGWDFWNWIMVAKFAVQLLPEDKIFAGNWVKEVQGIVTDQCWMEGRDPYEYRAHLSGGYWPVGENNWWVSNPHNSAEPYDFVGRSDEVIRHYRSFNSPIPCTSYVGQIMFYQPYPVNAQYLDVPIQGYPYVTNTLHLIINQDTVEYKRGNNKDGYDSSLERYYKP